MRTLGRMWCAVQCYDLVGTFGEFVTFHAASRLHHISHKSTLTSQFVPASPRGEAFFSKNRSFLTHSSGRWTLQTVEKASGAVAPKPSPGGEGAPVRTLGRMWCAVQCYDLVGTFGEFVTFHAASRLHHISHKSTLTSQFVPASPRGEAFFSKNRTFLTHSAPYGIRRRQKNRRGVSRVSVRQ